MMSGAGTSRGNNPDQGISTIASGATTAGEVTQDFQTPTKRSPKKRKLSLTPDKVPGSAVKAGAGCGDEEPEGQVWCQLCHFVKLHWWVRFSAVSIGFLVYCSRFVNGVCIACTNNNK